MSLRRTHIIFILLVSAFFFGADFVWSPSVRTAAAATDLNGRILLQVQEQGQAWYVNPLNGERYFLGRPADAFGVMRSLGLGITDSDFSSFGQQAPLRLAGRILLRVQAQGQAYYVNPLDRKLYYLGRPADAFALMRAQGLGISDADLDKITAFTAPTLTISTVAATSTAVHAIGQFDFKYQDDNYEITQNLTAAWYQAYQSSPKVYSYPSTVSTTTARDAFYGMFLAPQPGDTAVAGLAAKLKAIAATKGWTDDQLAEFTMAFIQYIPYDSAKLAQDSDRNDNPYYPYETLYLDRGVCSDKTFLAVALLRQLGYGAAILDFPDRNHSAAGIACPTADSLDGSGYCYVETTNYFPIGAIPQSISSGRADTVSNDFSSLFTTSALGRVEMYQITPGRSYGGVPANRAQAANLQNLKNDLVVRSGAVDAMASSTRAEEDGLTATKAQLDSYYANGQNAQYNALVPAYNVAVNKYNADLAAYQQVVQDYNQLVAQFNQALKEFYQK